MKGYVLGKFEDKERVRRVQRKLIEAGHSITHDWTLNGPERGKTVEQKCRESIEDVRGVATADLVVGVFIQDLSYRGAFAELGMAIISGKPVVLIGEYGYQCLFAYHPLVIAEYHTINDFLRNEKIFKYAGEVKIKEV